MKVCYEKARGCGFRKEGGLYLVGDRLTASCCKMPFPLAVCSACGEGIRFSRGGRWVDPSRLAGATDCTEDHPESCPLAGLVERAYLLWIGEKFYPTPLHFMIEAQKVGISRRITGLPKGLEPGKTWVLLAHRKGIFDGVSGESGEEVCTPAEVYTPAIVAAFVPTAIEKVVPQDFPEEEQEKLRKRRIEPVVVIPLDDAGAPPFPNMEGEKDAPNLQDQDGTPAAGAVGEQLPSEGAVSDGGVSKNL